MKVCSICRARFRVARPSCPLDGGELVDLPDPLIGTTIAGRYVVQEKIGAGGMGTVYRARHEIVGRDVAIKFLVPDLLHDASYRTRFLREARAANRINHEHVIDITDLGETDEGQVYLAMEFLDGFPLSRLIRGGPIELPRVLNVLTQVASALGRAHELDIIHRDIKPDNIFLLRGYPTDFVKVLDFGLAHVKGESRVTAAGSVMGTPEYMAPEQIRGAPIGPPSDIYSLGCVFFEMLTGRLPFMGTTAELVLKHMREQPVAPSAFAYDLSAEIDQLVLRMLAKDPELRPSAYELSEILRILFEPLREQLRPMTSSLPPPGASEQAVRSTMEVAQDWETRVALFRQLLPVAHPQGAPSWLHNALDRLEDSVAQIHEAREELDRRMTQAVEEHDEARGTRWRIGKALDSLSLDEMRLRRKLKEAHHDLDAAQKRLTRLSAQLRPPWVQLPSPPPAQDSMDPLHVSALRHIGQLASQWMEENAKIENLLDLEDQLRAAGEDLSFQIEQLKGRLASMSAESDAENIELASRSTLLEQKVEALMDDLAHTAEPVTRHFLQFPRLRDVLERANLSIAVAD